VDEACGGFGERDVVAGWRMSRNRVDRWGSDSVPARCRAVFGTAGDEISRLCGIRAIVCLRGNIYLALPYSSWRCLL
jgi:hypothetical protein